MSKRFENKVAVVTGGNSGIGLATAMGFANEGAQVVLTGRNAKTLEEAAAKVGHGAIAIQSDASSLTDITKLMQTVKEKCGRIDTLFVNAGVGAFIPVEQVTEEEFDRVMNTNLKGAYFTIKEALPLIPNGGSIVVNSSIGHCIGLPGNSVYAAAKAGLRSLARNLGAELVGRNIRVNCVSPGPIETPIITRSGLTPEGIEETRKGMVQRIPMHRMGTPEELAKAALFLASSDASFITGVDLLVDGGIVSFC